MSFSGNLSQLEIVNIYFQMSIPVVIALVGILVNRTMHSDLQKKREYTSRLDFIEKATNAVANLYENVELLSANNIRRNREKHDFEKQISNLPEERVNLLLPVMKTTEASLRNEHAYYLTKMHVSVGLLKELVKEENLAKLDEVIGKISSVAVKPGEFTEELKNEFANRINEISDFIHEKPDDMARHHWKEKYISNDHRELKGSK